MRRPPSCDDVRRPELAVRASGVLVNGYCAACGDGVTPDMVLEMSEAGAWVHVECVKGESDG